MMAGNSENIRASGPPSSNQQLLVRVPKQSDNEQSVKRNEFQRTEL